MQTELLSLSEWGEALPADGFEVFHTPAALDAVADHTAGDLRLYGGFKGEQPVALFPVVVREGPVGTVALSPPPGLSIPRLGPLLMPTSPKRRKREKVNGAFAEAVMDDLGVDSPLTLFRAACPRSYPDPRPYVWADMDLETAFTYRLAVDRDPDAILQDCSKSLRREIRDARDLDVSVTVETSENAVREVYARTRERYAEQGRGFTLAWEYVRQLTAGLVDDDRCRVYVLRDGAGDPLSGLVVLYSNDDAYYWLGGARTVHEGVSVNSLLHWRVVEDIAAGEPRESVDGYDLMGANTQRLCRYKSKFGASLVPYYVVESGGTGMNVAKRAYRMVSR